MSQQLVGPDVGFGENTTASHGNRAQRLFRPLLKEGGVPSVRIHAPCKEETSSGDRRVSRKLAQAILFGERGGGRNGAFNIALPCSSPANGMLYMMVRSSLGPTFASNHNWTSRYYSFCSVPDATPLTPPRRPLGITAHQHHHQRNLDPTRQLNKPSETLANACRILAEAFSHSKESEATGALIASFSRRKTFADL